MPKSNGYTTLEYNGVQLRNCQTMVFREVPVYDRTSQELKELKVTIKVAGYFTAGQNGSFGTHPELIDISVDPVSARTSSNTYRYLHTYLNERRKNLKYIFDDVPDTEGDVLYDITPAPAFIVGNEDDSDEPNLINTMTDVHGGPTPLGVEISEIAANNCWRVEFEVEFCTAPRCYLNDEGEPVELDPDDPLSPQFADGEIEDTELTGRHRQLGVLSNRWSCADSIDENQYTTRVYRGDVELANPNWNPHDYRYLTIPPLHPGMKRKAMEFTSTPDGLHLQYVITDQEVTMSAPGNTTSVKLSHTQSVSLTAPATTQFVSRAEVMGSRTASRNELFSTGVAMINSKMQLDQLLDRENAVFNVLVNRVESTDLQATEQGNSLAVSMSGTRAINTKAQNPLVAVDLLQHLNEEAVRRVQASPVAGDILAFYNNQRSAGNRDIRNENGDVIGFETPGTEGPLPSLSALSVALRSRCAKAFDMTDEVKGQLEEDAQFERQGFRSDLETGGDRNYDPADIFAPSTLIQISDSITTTQDSEFSTSHKESIYTEYKIESSYPEDHMTFRMPVADSTSSFGGGISTGTPTIPNSVIVSLGMPQQKRQIRVTAERFGSPPRLPTPVQVVDDGGAIAVLESADTKTLNPELAPGNSGFVYRAVLEMTYNYTTQPNMYRAGISDVYAATTGTPADDFRFTRGTLFSADWTLET